MRQFAILAISFCSIHRDPDDEDPCGGNFHNLQKFCIENFEEEFVERITRWQPGIIDPFIYLSWKTGAILHSELA